MCKLASWSVMKIFELPPRTSVAVSFMEEMLGSSMLNKKMLHHSMEADLMIECERPEQCRHC